MNRDKFIFANNKSIFNNSFNIADLNSLKMNFDFLFIFILMIYDSFQDQN